MQMPPNWFMQMGPGAVNTGSMPDNFPGMAAAMLTAQQQQHQASSGGGGGGGSARPGMGPSSFLDPAQLQALYVASGGKGAEEWLSKLQREREPASNLVSAGETGKKHVPSTEPQP